jgi:dTDP-4-dehydrorhamnose reductase
MLSDVASSTGAAVIYISTDSVFDGAKSGPYAESDATNPLNVYARTKLAGEQIVLAAPRGLVLRTNIFGWRWRGPDSFSEWVLAGLRRRDQLTMFTDVIYTPVASDELAGVIGGCIDRELSGLYHAGGGEALSKHDFAVKLAQVFELPADCILPIRMADKALTARRPANMALDSSRLAAALGRPMPGVDASLRTWKLGKPDWKELP